MLSEASPHGEGSRRDLSGPPSEEIAAALDGAQAAGATALNVLASSLLYRNRKIILDRSAMLRLPAIYQWPETAEEGGFAAYGPRFTKVNRQLARQVIKVRWRDRDPEHGRGLHVDHQLELGRLLDRNIRRLGAAQ
jgi:hypothetical protein